MRAIVGISFAQSTLSHVSTLETVYLPFRQSWLAAGQVIDDHASGDRSCCGTGHTSEKTRGYRDFNGARRGTVPEPTERPYWQCNLAVIGAAVQKWHSVRCYPPCLAKSVLESLWKICVMDHFGMCSTRPMPPLLCSIAEKVSKLRIVYW